MNLKILFLGALPALVAADILELQAKLPSCSLGCLAEGADTFNCNITDLYCQCTQLEDIKTVVAPCLVNVGGCELEEITGRFGESRSDALSCFVFADLTYDATGTVEVVAQMCVEYFTVNNLTLPSSDARSSDNQELEEDAGAANAVSIRVLGVALLASAATMFL